MQENNTNEKEIPETNGCLFADAIRDAEVGSPLYTKLAKHFSDEMYKAIKGAICTPERMAKLYPIFREINAETDNASLFWDKVETKQITKQAKKKPNKQKNQ